MHVCLSKVINHLGDIASWLCFSNCCALQFRARQLAPLSVECQYVIIALYSCDRCHHMVEVYWCINSIKTTGRSNLCNHMELSKTIEGLAEIKITSNNFSLTWDHG